MAKDTDLEFTYDVYLRLDLTERMIGVLMEWSHNHYDGYCQSVGKIGGFIYGWSNGYRFGVKTVFASWHQLDTICKILEHRDSPPDLVERFKGLLQILTIEHNRVNSTF